jgi:dipeptidase
MVYDKDMTRRIKTSHTLAVTLFLVGLYLFPSTVMSCTLVMVGKRASVDGSVLLAHNNDLPERVASLIQIVPGMAQPAAGAARTYRMLIMNCHYGFSEGDAVAINEHGVAIGGGQSYKDDRSDLARQRDPLVKQGVSGHIRYIALQRSKTARQCVKIMGQMYSTHGIAYPSGVGVADGDEVWYIEAAGGRCWAAVRVPKDSYLAAANGYRIGIIDFDDKENYIIPPYLKEYVVKARLWKPRKGPFHFARTFGGKAKPDNPYYNSRRVWRIQSLLTPSLKQNPRSREHPLFLKPDRKISLEMLTSILRDHYQGTEFDTAKGSSERAIGIFNTVHTGVIQLRSWLPVEVGAVMWASTGPALTTPYVPYYFGIQQIPAPLRTAGPHFDAASAYWNFRNLTDIVEADFSPTISKVLPIWQQFEAKLFALQPVIEKTALKLYHKDKTLTLDFLTLYCGGLALQALNQTGELIRRFLKNQ